MGWAANFVTVFCLYGTLQGTETSSAFPLSVRRTAVSRDFFRKELPGGPSLRGGSGILPPASRQRFFFLRRPPLPTQCGSLLIQPPFSPRSAVLMYIFLKPVVI